MPIKPWMTSDDIISAVKRKISFPTSQQTFNEDDILAFANEEMFIAQVPSVLLYHEEFFVSAKNVELVANKTRYSIPDRSIGMKLRDLFYKDTNDNLYEMVRINPEEKATFQRNYNSGTPPNPYYIEGNEIVLVTNELASPTGDLQFTFFMRPNQLVTDDNAATIESFCKEVTLVNASISSGDTITITDADGNEAIFTATSGSPITDEFLIGVTGTATATNLVSAINTNGIASATNSGAVVTISYDVLGLTVETDNDVGFVIDEDQCINFDQIPDNIVNGAVIDFLQTKPGHRILTYDIEIPSTGISGLMISFDSDDVPDTVSVGDYICLANTSIIPYLPPDLHNVLAERTSARILAAIGDLENLGAVKEKIKEMEANQGMLLDNRIEGRPQKVTNRHSLLRSGRRTTIRRF